MRFITLFTVFTIWGTKAFGFSNPLVANRNQKLANLPIGKQLDATMEGILRNILFHRDFGAEFVMFSTWEDSKNELYLVPSYSEKDLQLPAKGLGYRLITESDEPVGVSSDSNELLKVLEIQEEDITALGFPTLFHWNGESQDDSLTFGSKKIILDEINKNSVNAEFELDNDFLFTSLTSADVFDPTYYNEREYTIITEYTTVHTTVTTTVIAAPESHIVNKPPITTDEQASTPIDSETPESSKNGEFEFQFPGNPELSLASSISALEPEQTSIGTKTASHDETPSIVVIVTTERAWDYTTIDVESPEFEGMPMIPTTSPEISSGSITRTKIKPTVYPSKVHSYSGSSLGIVTSGTKRGVNSMSRGLSSFYDFPANGTKIPNNGLGNFEYQTRNSMLGIICVLASMTFFF